MAWSDPVSAYCERLAPGWLGEPLNSISNIAFVAAALALLRLHARLQARGEGMPADVCALPWLVFSVGVCSLLFHTLATRWAGWLDSLSILLYCALAVYSFVRHATAAGPAIAAGAAVLFATASFGSSRLLPAGTMNGSAAYLPNLLTLLAVTVYLRVQRAPGFRSFALASGIFAVALTLRTLDLAWCSALPFGTHFLWHLLTGVLLWLVSRELTLRRYSFSG
jgi:Ceramidase